MIKRTKSILAATALVAFAAIGFTGCQTSGQKATASVENYLPAIQSGAEIATSLALQAQGDKATAIQPNLYAIASALRSVSGGKAPTPAEVQAAIAKFTANTTASAVASLIAQQIGASYAGYYPSISGNAKLALEVLEAFAAGVEAGAAK